MQLLNCNIRLNVGNIQCVKMKRKSILISCHHVSYCKLLKYSDVDQCPGRFFAFSPTGYLYIVIFRFSLYLGGNSIDFFEMIGNFPEVLNFNQLFLKLSGQFCYDTTVDD